MLSPLICPPRGLASTNQGRAHSILFFLLTWGRDASFLSVFSSPPDGGFFFFPGRKKIACYQNNIVWGEKTLVTKKGISRLFLFLLSSNRFLFLFFVFFLGRWWGWVYAGTQDVGGRKGYMSICRHSQPGPVCFAYLNSILFTQS